MNPDPQNQLEREVDRLLKGLPPISAPRTLNSRVMAAIQMRASLPWYRRAWTTWGTSGQTTSMVVMLALFALGCFLASWAPNQAFLDVPVEKVQGLSTQGNVLLGAVGAVLSAGQAVLRPLGSGFIIGCLAAIALGFAACVALGTFYFRLAMAPRENR